MNARSNSRRLTSIPIISTILVVVLIAWASFAKLDQVSRASAQIIPAGRTQLIQSAEGGVIDKIFVREGDLVKRGQVLVTLDSAKLLAAVTEGESKVASLKGTLARIEAEPRITAAAACTAAASARPPQRPAERRWRPAAAWAPPLQLQTVARARWGR